MQHRFKRPDLELRRPRNASAFSLKLPRVAFCALVRADSESANDMGCSGGSDGVLRGFHRNTEE
eukprot:9467225-Alexandrium_andersonii.AAC.1